MKTWEYENMSTGEPWSRWIDPRGTLTDPRGNAHHIMWYVLRSVWYFAPCTICIPGRIRFVDPKGTPTDLRGNAHHIMWCVLHSVWYFAPFTAPCGPKRYPHGTISRGVYFAPCDTLLRIHVSVIVVKVYPCSGFNNTIFYIMKSRGFCIKSVSRVRSISEVWKYPCPEFRSSWIPVCLVL